jgi:hypothetical protein
MVIYGQRHLTECSPHSFIQTQSLITHVSDVDVHVVTYVNCLSVLKTHHVTCSDMGLEC